MSEMAWQWRVFRAELDPARGSEQAGTRPVLVVSNEATNAALKIVTVLPITTRKPGRRVYSTEALLPTGTAGLPNESIVMAHQIRTIARERLQNAYGEIEDETLRRQIQGAMKMHLDLIT